MSRGATRFDFSARGVERRASLEPADQLQHAEIRRVVRECGPVQEQVGVARQCAYGHHANDGDRRAVDGRCWPMSDGSRPVAARPQPLADEDGRASRVARILRAEVAPESRAHAEDVKVVGGDDRRLHLLRLGVPRQSVADVGRGHGSHARERRQVRAPGLVLARRELDRLDAFLEIRLPENGEPFRLIDRQRAQQHRLHGRGDRRRRADADAERGRGRNHQGWSLDELTEEAASRCKLMRYA